MVGDNVDRKLKVKGGEAHSVLLFIDAELKRDRARAIPKHALYSKGVSALVQLNQLFHDAGWRMDTEDRHQAHNLYNQYIDSAVALDVVLPKTHLGAHLLADIEWFGNPKFYAAWKDEGWNRTLKQCARGLSQATFDVCILAAVNFQLGQYCIDQAEAKATFLSKP